MNLLDTFENKYIIKGVIKTLSPIHIGTGQNDFSPISLDHAVIKDKDNKPFIPGTSLKGVLRSYMERLLKTGCFENYTSCLITDTPCVDKNDVKKIKSNFKNIDDNTIKKISVEIYKNQCDVCKMFGGKAFASKIQINDCKLLNDNYKIEQRDGVSISRDTLTGVKGRKYNFESVSSQTEFSFEMTIDNLEDKHKDLLKLIINVLKSGDLKVGGKTSAGLGAVQLIDEKVYLITKENLREYYMNGINDNNKEKMEVTL